MEALLVGITLAAAIAVALLIRKKISKQNTHYDERQLMLRAAGYRIGFIGTIAAVFVLIFLYSFDGGIEDVIEPALSMFIAVMIGIVVFAVYCIRKGAFLQINANGNSYIILLLVIIVLNGALGIWRMVDGTLWENGVMMFTRGGSNLVLAIGFFIVLVALLADNTRRKGEAAE